MGKKSSGNMKLIWSAVLFLSLVLLMNKCVFGGLNFREDSVVSSGSTGTVGRLVKKEERVPIVATEFGEISAIDVDDGGFGKGRRNYHLQFITLEPNSLFLPVLLHAEMVFYVQTGSGKLSWTDSDGDELNRVSLRRGDVYRLKSGTLFYLHSSLESERPRLRIIAIFANPEEEQLQGALIGPYSSINDLVRGFDKRILQAAFQVSEEVIEELTSATDTPAIVHAETKSKNFWQKELLYINAFIQRYSNQVTENKKKRTKTFNFFKEKPDFENCNGWSTVVTNHDLHALHGSHIGVFMVNLTRGSMMGPHWNPMATEVTIVLEGEGMVRVVCPSALTNKECKNSRFRIEEGDVFSVPRFHPMAQTSFNNGSLVFMGFSTTTKQNHPQFLAGKASVLNTLSKPVLGASFNVSNTTIDQLLAAQEKAIILDCTSCAEEQEMIMEDEIEQERQKEEERRREEEEEARRREEEERRRREEEEQRRREEEERRRQEEEEQRRRKEEEEKRRQEEEEQRRREEEEEQQRKHEEEEKRRQEEEEQRRREEDEERRRHEEEEQRREEEEKRRQEEEEQRRQEEEEEQQRRKEEEKRRQEEEEQRRREEEEEQQRKHEEREEKQRRQEEEEQRQREQEEEEQRQREQEEQRRREEEERQREQEEKRRREEEEEEEERVREQEEKRRREEEEEEREREQEEQRRHEEERQQQEEERREQEEQRRHEEERREQEEQRRQEEKRRRHEEEEEQTRREEEAARQEEKERRRKEEEWRRRQEEEGRGEEETEQEIARREEEERREWERQAEEAARKRQEGEGSGDGNREGRRVLRRTTKVSHVHW